MPQTPPAHFLMPRKLTNTELAQAIRVGLEAELDAFNLYQSHIDATDDELAKKVLAHIRDEEREHASLFWALLKHLDPRVIDEDKDALAKVELLGQGKTESEIRAILKKREAEAESTPAETPAPQATLTVGSLRRQR